MPLERAAVEMAVDYRTTSALIKLRQVGPYLQLVWLPTFASNLAHQETHAIGHVCQTANHTQSQIIYWQLYFITKVVGVFTYSHGLVEGSVPEWVLKTKHINLSMQSSDIWISYTVFLLSLDIHYNHPFESLSSAPLWISLLIGQFVCCTGLYWDPDTFFITIIVMSPILIIYWNHNNAFYNVHC